MVFADSVFDTFIILSFSIALAFETFAVCSQAAQRALLRRAPFSCKLSMSVLGFKPERHEMTSSERVNACPS